MLCGMIQVTMAKVGSHVDQQTGENLVQLLIMMFQKEKKVTESGLIAYQGVVCGLGSKVNIKDFGQYLFWALEGEDEDCTRLACGIISDLASAFKEDIAQYLSSLVPHLLTVLKAPERERRSKLIAFQSLGDVAFFAAKSFCQNYLNESLVILNSASQMSM